jgi:hypothetical protein
MIFFWLVFKNLLALVDIQDQKKLQGEEQKKLDVLVKG